MRRKSNLTKSSELPPPNPLTIWLPFCCLIEQLNGSLIAAFQSYRKQTCSYWLPGILNSEPIRNSHPPSLDDWQRSEVRFGSLRSSPIGLMRQTPVLTCVCANSHYCSLGWWWRWGVVSLFALFSFGRLDPWKSTLVIPMADRVCVCVRMY